MENSILILIIHNLYVFAKTLKNYFIKIILQFKIYILLKID